MVRNRVSKMWLLGELGILLFCPPGFCDVGGLLRALSSSGHIGDYMCDLNLNPPHFGSNFVSIFASISHHFSLII
jgi:hypothetical protein